MAIQVIKLLETTVNATSAVVSDILSGATIQTSLEGTGVRTATVDIQVSLDNVHWFTLASIGLDETYTEDGMLSMGDWIYYRAVCSGMSGTNPKVIVLMSVTS